MAPRRTVSLAAERAVRYLRGRPAAVPSTELIRETLATSVADEDAATRILETAFGGDPRLVHRDRAWSLADPASIPSSGAPSEDAAAAETDRVLVLLEGDREAGTRRFVLRAVTAIRISGDEIREACGGGTTQGPDAALLREEVRGILEGAVPVVHDPPGALWAFEAWLDEPLQAPISLRRLGQARRALPARHRLADLAERLGLTWRETDDPVDVAETLDGCLAALREPGETLRDLQSASSGGVPPLSWERYAFDRAFLRSLPETPGTYRFFDRDGGLLYVGKAADLRRRVGSYFREGLHRTARVASLVGAVHRIEVEPTGSDLEAVLREAAQISRRRPSRNVQRETHVHRTRAARLDSILILEPASPPHVLRAYLIRDGELVDKVLLGPRGGGLRRVERVLEDRFFSYRGGPSATAPESVDVERIARWLAAHRDRVVAFDPTHLKSAREVIARLRWFLRGGLEDPDGTPVVTR